MKRGGLVFVLAALCILFSGVVNGSTIELMHLNETDLRSAMDITIISCIEDAQNVQNSLVCKNNFKTLELETVKYNDTCYVSYVDLHNFECVDISMQAIFEQDEKIKKISETIHAKQVFIEPRKILATQKWDGGWDTASNTAYAVWILSEFPERYERQIEDGMQWLKDNRDDDTKCWAYDSFSSSCSVYETSRTLGFLGLAGYNDTHRIKSDGRIWLESRQNYIENDEGWQLVIKPKSDGNCTILYEDASIFSQDINSSERYEVSFTPDYGSLLNFSCSVRTSFSIYDHLNRNIFGYTFDEDDDYDYDYTITGSETNDEDRDSQRYRFNPPCWSATSKWEYCNLETTLYSLIPELTTEQRDLALDWFEDQVGNDTIRGRYIRTRNQIFDSALYLYAIDGATEEIRDEISEWLVYNQNNDGSWGAGTNEEKALPTAMALLALKGESFETKTEVLADGRSWFSTNTPLSGWNDVKHDAVSFMILKDNARPFLKLHPSNAVSIESSGASIVLINPTEFDANNLTYEVLGEASSVLTMSLPVNVSRYSNETASLSVSSSAAGTYTGLIYVRNSTGTPMVSFPVSVKTKSSVDISIGTQVKMFDGSGTLDVEVKGSNVDVTCNVNTLSNTIDITSSITSSVGKKTLTVGYEPITDEFIETVVITCDTPDEQFVFEEQVKIMSFATYPIEFVEDEVVVTKSGQNKWFVIQNRLNTSVDIELSVEGGSELFVVEPNFIEIEGQKKARVKLVNQVPGEVNLTTDGKVKASSLGYTTEAPFTVDIIYNPNAGDWIWVVLYWLIFVAILGGAGYAGYTYRKPVLKFASDGYNAVLPKMPKAILKYLPGGKQLLQEQANPGAADGGGSGKKAANEWKYYEDIVRIMRTLGKQDSEIKERLAAEGLSEERMNSILGELAQAEELEGELRHEDQVKKLLESVANEEGEIFRKLRDQGYTEEQIKQAMDELEGTVKSKKKELEEEYKKFE